MCKEITCLVMRCLLHNLIFKISDSKILLLPMICLFLPHLKTTIRKKENKEEMMGLMNMGHISEDMRAHIISTMTLYCLKG